MNKCSVPRDNSKRADTQKALQARVEERDLQLGTMICEGAVPLVAEAIPAGAAHRGLRVRCFEYQAADRNNIGKDMESVDRESVVHSGKAEGECRCVQMCDGDKRRQVWKLLLSVK